MGGDFRKRNAEGDPEKARSHCQHEGILEEGRRRYASRHDVDAHPVEKKVPSDQVEQRQDRPPFPQKGIADGKSQECVVSVRCAQEEGLAKTLLQPADLRDADGKEVDGKKRQESCGAHPEELFQRNAPEAADGVKNGDGEKEVEDEVVDGADGEGDLFHEDVSHHHNGKHPEHVLESFSHGREAYGFPRATASGNSCSHNA